MSVRFAINLCTSLALCLFAVVTTAQAQPMIFFGEDLSTDGGPPAEMPNSNSARDAFLTHLTFHATEDFDDYMHHEIPATLTFGAEVATLAGAEGSRVMERPTGHYQGVWPTSRPNFLYTYKNQDQNPDRDPLTFEIQFGTPHSAIGLFVTDLSDIASGGQLSVRLETPNGLETDIVVPHSLNAPSGSVVYFGVSSADAEFNRVVFHYTQPQWDGFGVDDITINVPEPGTAAITVSSFVVLLLGSRQRRRVGRCIC